MAESTLLYITVPKVQDLPVTVDPYSLAYFGRWSSGHLSHLSQHDMAYGAAVGVKAEEVKMSYAEYQRLYAESHWYERK